MPSILRPAVLLCQLLMILRASLYTALFDLVYSRWLVEENEVIGLLMNKKSDNGDPAITLNNVRAYVREGVVSLRTN